MSPFFDFLNRRGDSSFDDYFLTHAEGEHYINWNDFLLPNDYGDAEYEYHAIRNSCAMCDVTPLRKIRVQGNGAGAFFDRLLTRPISSLPIMRAAYSVFCDDDGYLKDDAIVYKFDEDDYLMMPSDIDHRTYFESVRERFSIDEVTFNECTDAWAGAAIQGPQSAAALQQMGCDTVDEMQPFEVREYYLGGGAISVARMGFTADLGYECWMSPLLVDAFIERVTETRAEMGIDLPGYGLDALQVCRLEGGFIVAGWDCSTDIDPQPGFERTPFELGLSWLVDLDGPDFVGKDALRKLKENGPANLLRYLSTPQDIRLESGADILAGDSDEIIGRVNTAKWSWGLEQTIGNASVLAEYADSKSACVVVGGKSVSIELHRKPLIELQRHDQVPAPIA